MKTHFTAVISFVKLVGAKSSVEMKGLSKPVMKILTDGHVTCAVRTMVVIYTTTAHVLNVVSVLP